MGVKFKLIIMNFLEYAVWGAWLISIGGYLGGKLSFDAVQIGSIFAAQGIASLFMPSLMGIVADRWIAPNKLLGICHFLAAAFMIAAAPMTTYGSFYPMMLMSVMFFMPTISLSNSVAYGVLDRAKLDSVSVFPKIRVWGTIGFIAAMWVVDLTGFASNANQMYLSAGLGILLGVYAFFLPGNPIVKNVKRESIVDKLGLRAFALFKEKRMAIFFIFSMLLGMLLQITNAYANDYLVNWFGAMPEYQGTFGVEHPTILISLSQISEALCILLIPFFLKRFGIKKVMLISMFAWVLRFALLGAGNPGPGLWMLIISMLVYGVAFDFFNISGSLFVDKETDPSIRSSAQGVFMMMTNGFGALIGSYAAGFVVKAYGWPVSWYIFAGFALLMAIVFAIVFKYKHNPEEMKNVKV